MSHESSHAYEMATDQAGRSKRYEEDKANKVDYYERRGEVRADQTLMSIRAQRLFNNNGVTSFKPHLAFPAKPMFNPLKEGKKK